MLIVTILLIWIGCELDAPNWYYWALGILTLWNIFYLIGGDNDD